MTEPSAFAVLAGHWLESATHNTSSEKIVNASKLVHSYMEEKEKPLKVDRDKFENAVKKLLQADPVKREDVRVKNPKNRKKLIPPSGEHENETD
jgi:hypothetical protein